MAIAAASPVFPLVKYAGLHPSKPKAGLLGTPGEDAGMAGQEAGATATHASYWEFSGLAGEGACPFSKCAH